MDKEERLRSEITLIYLLGKEDGNAANKTVMKYLIDEKPIFKLSDKEVEQAIKKSRLKQSKIIK